MFQEHAMNDTAAGTTSATSDKPYDRMGGASVLRDVIDRFYNLMATDPDAAAVRAMHADDLAPMRQTLFEFLSGWLGGPPLYFQRPNRKCVMSAHDAFPIGAAERDAWLACMRQAMTDVGVDEDLRHLIMGALSPMADAMRSR
jgi:hemoglobin